MDFGTLLKTAKENEYNKKEVRSYSTKFGPPKKEEKKARALSANIQKFLARKEADENKKRNEAHKIRDDLLALRSKDKKATRRVNVMLKRTKSANQSVIEDAIDKDNTAVTLAGPSQPDEDDYGYVSQEAAAFYNKMMEKYNKMPDDPKFSKVKRKASSNLSSTKDRVKAALEKEKEEAMLPHRRKRKHKDQVDNQTNMSDQGYDKYDQAERNEPPVKVKQKSSGPPPMNFSDLLKLAAQKQHEPIVIEVKPKEEEGPLLTKKQKKDQERTLQQRKETRKPIMELPLGKLNSEQVENQNRIPKVSPTLLNDHKTKESNGNRITKSNNISNNNVKIVKGNIQAANNNDKSGLLATTSQNVKVYDKFNLSKSALKTQKSSLKSETSSNKLNAIKQKSPNDFTKRNPEILVSDKGSNSTISSDRKDFTVKRSLNNSLIQSTSKSISKPNTNMSIHQKLAKFNGNSKEFDKSKSTKEKELHLKNNIAKGFPPNDLKPRQFPPKDLKCRQFPPPDVRRKEFPQKEIKRKLPLGNKRRLLDDEDYDSEMDDFIDDDPNEMEDYSKYIKDIFGYDKSKYRGADEDDVDNMESSFAQQMKEDIRSTKLGIMEDLEDIQREKDEKRRKAVLKKRRKL